MAPLPIDNGQAIIVGPTPEGIRQRPLWISCKPILKTILYLAMAVLLPSPLVQAQDGKIVIPEGVVLSQEQRQAMKEHVRQELRKQRQESDLATGNRYGVTATANCLEGYVQDAEIRKSAPDVAIVAEEGVICNAKGCQGWQVEAQRASAELFDIEIVLQCTQEDWVRIEPLRE